VKPAGTKCVDFYLLCGTKRYKGNTCWEMSLGKFMGILVGTLISLLVASGLLYFIYYKVAERIRNRKTAVPYFSNGKWFWKATKSFRVNMVSFQSNLKRIRILKLNFLL
jgi:hypothetical protein